MLLITKNNLQLGLSNGDIVRVLEVRESVAKRRIRLPNGECTDLLFTPLKIAPQDAGRDGAPLTVTVLENLLHCHRRSLDAIDQLALLWLARERYGSPDADGDDFKDFLRSDPFYNALQVKFGYALTCHKAQGGEWPHVIVDLGDSALVTQDDWRWFYTAVTRARERLTLVNI